MGGTGTTRRGARVDGASWAFGFRFSLLGRCVSLSSPREVLFSRFMSVASSTTCRHIYFLGVSHAHGACGSHFPPTQARRVHSTTDVVSATVATTGTTKSARVKEPVCGRTMEAAAARAAGSAGMYGWAVGMGPVVLRAKRIQIM